LCAALPDILKNASEMFKKCKESGKKDIEDIVRFVHPGEKYTAKEIEKMRKEKKMKQEKKEVSKKKKEEEKRKKKEKGGSDSSMSD